jgi:hypothetical protein
MCRTTDGSEAEFHARKVLPAGKKTNKPTKENWTLEKRTRWPWTSREPLEVLRSVSGEVAAVLNAEAVDAKPTDDDTDVTLKNANRELLAQLLHLKNRTRRHT